MNEIITLLSNQLGRMTKDGSFVVGSLGGLVSLAVPEWINHEGWDHYHTIMIVILLAVFIMDWMAGSALARRSTVKRKTSEVANDSLIRDGIVMGVCLSAFGVDQLLESTGSWVFVIFTAAFIYHNFYSLMANVAVLGWEPYFPMWLLKWLQDEIETKKEKYFPADHSN